MQKKAVRTEFDRDFFARFYHDAGTSVISEDDVFRRACFVLSYLAYLRIGVHSVLDAGCGTGLWKRALRRIDRSIEYVGIDPSEYLCRTHGWVQSGVEGFRPRRRFDLVVCQDVMQYMDTTQVKNSFTNLARLCSGALYFDVPTREDIDDGFLDMRKTDRRIHVRGAAWYRRQLGTDFVSAGGGVFVTRRSRAVVLALERGR
jgi:SAM-dependent methyltransferase